MTQFAGYFTGFADEVSSDLNLQIKATKELGWSNIECRTVGSANLHDISDAEFDAAVRLLEESGIKVNCFGATICNWGHKITDPFDITLAEVKRAIPRMKRLGTKMIRIMSYALLPDLPMSQQMAEERFRRLREVTKMFLDNGLQPLHENCNNYAGQGWKFTLEMLEAVPGLRLIFDTGNPTFTYDRSKPEPFPLESAWEFYDHVKDFVDYIHIKDAIYDKEKDKIDFKFCGEGNGDVRKILTDLLVNRHYAGGISIEPHLGHVFHDPDHKDREDDYRYNVYVEYGRRLQAMVEDILNSK
jgi:sugar phosphate isomerase/epimerase